MTDEKFLSDVLTELEKARKKFPKTKNIIVALMEEVGELSEALLKLTEDGELNEKELNERTMNVYKEAVQVASTALRVAVEGDISMGYRGICCSYKNCKQPPIGGPCFLCYE